MNIIETPRLILRPIALTDNEALFKVWSDKQVTEFMNVEGFETLNQINEMLDFLISLMHEKKATRYVIVLKDTGEVIGTCGHNSFNDLTTEIAYDLGYKYWGHGYALETMTYFIQYSMDSLDMNTFIAYVEPENVASKNLLKKLGFKFIDLLKNKEKVGDSLIDVEFWCLNTK